METGPDRPVCEVFDRCVASPAPEAVRDAALLSVFFGAGMGFRAIAGLDRVDYRGDGLLVGSDGGLLRARSGARLALERWSWLRGRRPGPLFRDLAPRGARTGGRPTHASLRRAVERRMSAAGMSRMSPEALARGYRSPWWEEA